MTRKLRPPRPVTPRAPLPADVRLLNAVSSAVFALAGVGAVAAGGAWLMRSNVFPIRAIQLEGELTRNSVPTIRANAAPRLAGNFFSADLQDGRRAFEAVPWVRRAVVRRVWPDRLAVYLEEHRAAALWEGPRDERGAERLVNQQGEVFEANVGDVEDEGLPALAGPDGSSAAMLALLQRLQPVFARLEAAVTRVELSGRGSWRVELDNGATVELGRGSDAELLARTERFVRTLGPATGGWQAPLLYADLRHTDGYAVRLRGVSTTSTPAGANKPAAKTH
ncbi:Cell division protein FtsQ [Rubrivivax sp. A210]|uniref:cell division protein FtsQ/DivIB n=1 Tax=Rubrivivax sp. A210 TaxID=2772301 RepID=UPI0019B33A90|nr:cell division protein FtsQ/DivIB [Rubrivivax sp. A210]CAD5370515.1 Cell division protein FtsQ [Rubrivivax sp. A210]